MPVNCARLDGGVLPAPIRSSLRLPARHRGRTLSTCEGSCVHLVSSFWFFVCSVSPPPAMLQLPFLARARAWAPRRGARRGRGIGRIVGNNHVRAKCTAREMYRAPRRAVAGSTRAVPASAVCWRTCDVSGSAGTALYVRRRPGHPASGDTVSGQSSATAPRAPSVSHAASTGRSVARATPTR